jgi:hypothetical protein
VNAFFDVAKTERDGKIAWAVIATKDGAQREVGWYEPRQEATNAARISQQLSDAYDEAD